MTERFIIKHTDPGYAVVIDTATGEPIKNAGGDRVYESLIENAQWTAGRLNFSDEIAPQEVAPVATEEDEEGWTPTPGCEVAENTAPSIPATSDESTPLDTWQRIALDYAGRLGVLEAQVTGVRGLVLGALAGLVGIPDSNPRLQSQYSVEMLETVLARLKMIEATFD